MWVALKPGIDMIVQISAITLSDALGFWTVRKKLGPNIARTTTVWIEFSVEPVFTSSVAYS